MLVISRKPGEAVRIGEDIELRIVRSSASRVSIAIDAPRVLPIRREDRRPAARAAAAQPCRAQSRTA